MVISLIKIFYRGDIIVQEDLVPVFYDKLHQHEEIQISYIIEGEGTLIVGDTVNGYDSGDVIVIGENIPHVYKSDTNASKMSHMVSLFFTKNSFGVDFFQLQELETLNAFFKRSEHGFKITSQQNNIRKLLSKVVKNEGVNRFVSFLELLQQASIVDYKSLSSFIYEKKYTDVEGERMRNVFEFTINNFENDISLDAIAEVANLTKNAFCKYFKKRTNKTYVQFLNELRIENACKLLNSNRDLSVAEVADRSGFKNISNFNRQFKAVKKTNPTKFRKKYRVS